jgi:transcriptional regulator with XRE-family HTH domain
MTALLRGIGGRVRQARRRAGMSLDDLASAIRSEPATLSRYERARRAFPIETLERVADALHVPVFELIGSAPTSPRRDLAPDEEKLLRIYRAMRPSLKKVCLRLLEELHRAAR